MMKIRVCSFLMVAAFASAGLGCSEDVDGQAGADRASTATARDLVPGDHGPEVLAAFEYLRAYGYFPNGELAVRHPSWTPVIDHMPEDPSYFGAELAEALRAFQRQGGLDETGLLDGRTRALMKEERCANPDFEFAPRPASDSREKWNHQTGMDGSFFTSAFLSWFVKSCVGQNGGACPSYASGGAESIAFSKWQSETKLSFGRSSSCGPSCTPHFEIRYYDNANLPDPSWLVFPDGALGGAWKTSASTARVAVNTAIAWNPERLVKFFTHEIGHALGLAHSAVGVDAQSGQPSTSMMINANTTSPITSGDEATMYFRIRGTTGPVCPSLGQCWNLTLDDRQSILSRCDTSTFPPNNCYSAWTQLPGLAVDVAVGGTVPVGPITWVTSGNNTVWKRGVSSFHQDSTGNGVSIAVTGAGVPWVVSSSNVVRRRTDGSCTLNAQGQCVGSWNSPSGGGSARDIAIGGPNDTTWIVTNSGGAGGDFPVRFFNGSSFVVPSRAMQAVRITVDAKGFPWVVKANHSIWTSASVDGSAVWTQVTAGASCANDIGAGRNGGVYVIGCTPIGTAGDFDIWIFNQQVATPAMSGTASVTGWRPLSGFARRIAVGPDARPYVVQASGGIFNLEGI